VAEAKMDSESFRRVMGHFATGVTVVTARTAGGAPLGFTANSLTGVSLDPLLLLVCLDRNSNSRDALLASGAFAVNILPAGPWGEEVCRRFAGRDREGRFHDLAFRTESTGSPVLDDALAWLDCRVWKEVEAGDHTVVLGEVDACGYGEGDPLLYFRGAFRALGDG